MRTNRRVTTASYASGLSFLALLTSIVLASVSFARRRPEPSLRRPTPTPPPPAPLCDATGACLTGDLQLYLDESSVGSIIGLSPGRSLADCAGHFHSVEMGGHMKSKDRYVRTSIGPAGCTCLVRCKYGRTCDGRIRPLDAWLLLAPAINAPRESMCACAHARWPDAVPGVCDGLESPKLPEEALITAYAPANSEDKACLDADAGPQEWRVIDTVNRTWNQANIAARCSNTATSSCISCASECRRFETAECPYQWPSKCANGQITCTYGCANQPAVTLACQLNQTQSQAVK